MYQILISEVRRRILEESFFRIRKCLSLLEDDAIWWRPNEQSNSVGNLVLHLCGNARQWMLSALGGLPDTRQRQAEFDERGPVARTELLSLLDTLERELSALLDRLGPEDLERMYEVQGFQESGVAILVHVTEHVSYHTGQITYFVKMHTGKDTGYYAGQNLDVVA
ncbi:MAG: DUF1572 domain-containing protein [Bacteroidetes bacterium]|nr:MAG: DUF1572 domain-containing protein [Bacteroidota bacterium]